MGYVPPRLPRFPTLLPAPDACCEYCGRRWKDSEGKLTCVGCGSDNPFGSRPLPLETSSYGTQPVRR